MPAITRMKTNQRMSAINICNGIVYLAGQVGGEEATVTEQAKTMLAKADALLTEAGSSREHMLSATVYLRDMKYFEEFNAVWNAWVPQGHAPARACVQAYMARENVLCEVSIVAAQK